MSCGFALSFIAQIVGPNGHAEFRQENTRRRFAVEIEGLRPEQTFDVMVAGVVVGTIRITADGKGELEFRDREVEQERQAQEPQAQQEQEEQPFPANFPLLDGGELIQVGPLTGTLQPD